MPVSGLALMTGMQPQSDSYIRWAARLIVSLSLQTFTSRVINRSTFTFVSPGSVW